MTTAASTNFFLQLWAGQFPLMPNGHPSIKLAPLAIPFRQRLVVLEAAYLRECRNPTFIITRYNHISFSFKALYGAVTARFGASHWFPNYHPAFIHSFFSLKGTFCLLSAMATLPFGSPCLL
jgi:hypothetical protein